MNSKEVFDLIKNDYVILSRLGEYVGYQDREAPSPAILLLLIHELEGGRYRFSLGIDSASGVEVIVLRDPAYSDTNDRIFQIVLIEHTIYNIDNLEIIADRIKSLIPNAEIGVIQSDLVRPQETRS